MHQNVAFVEELLKNFLPAASKLSTFASGNIVPLKSKERERESEMEIFSINAQ